MNCGLPSLSFVTKPSKFSRLRTSSIEVRNRFVPDVDLVTNPPITRSSSSSMSKYISHASEYRYNSKTWYETVTARFFNSERLHRIGRKPLDCKLSISHGLYPMGHSACLHIGPLKSVHIHILERKMIELRMHEISELNYIPVHPCRYELTNEWPVF